MIPRALDDGYSKGSPERALMAAVLRRAIFDALMPPNETREHGNSEIFCESNARSGARAWFFKPEKWDGSFFTFQQIVDELEIPKDKLLDFLTKNETWPVIEDETQKPVYRPNQVRYV